MKVKDLIEELKEMPQEASIELRKILSVVPSTHEASFVALDLPIIGIAHRPDQSGDSSKDDVVLVVEKHPHVGKVGKFIDFKTKDLPS